MSKRRYPASNVPASRVRYGVLAFACTLSMVTYLDRVAVASAAGDIVSALGLKSVADIKWVFTAFALAYALFEVPTGWMGDTFGPRKSLLRIVLWWSVFTLLTAAVGLQLGPVTAGLGFLVVVRFLFGIGEAGAYFLALCLMYAAQGYGWWFNITYLPQFLEHHYGMPNSSLLGALYKGGPLWMGAIGSLLGGLIPDRIVRRTGNLRLGRRLCGFAGHAVCVACFLACPFAPNAFLFFLAVSLAAFSTDLSVPSAWATCQDIGGRCSAVVGAFMNMMAGISGAIAGAVTGLVLERSVAQRAIELGVAAADLTAEQTTAAMLRGYHWNFYLFAALYAVAFLCWFRIDPTKKISP